MAEKRIPAFIFLLKKQGKRSNKIELFKADLWKDNEKVKWLYDDDYFDNRFRLRINGKWYSPYEQFSFFTKSEIRDILWRSIKF